MKGTLLAGVTALALHGCDGGGFTRLSEAGQFEPSAIDLGEVTIGLTAERSVSLRNTGSIAWKISRVELPSGFRLGLGKDALEGRTVEAGESVSLTVSFSSQAEERRQGQIVVVTDELRIPLSATAAGVAGSQTSLVLETTTLDFGRVLVGQRRESSVFVRNDGPVSGVVERVELVSSGTPFALVTPMPLTIGPGARVPISFVFAPSQAGAFGPVTAGIVRGQGALDLELRGEGVEASDEIVCSPSPLVFGALERGERRSLDIECTAFGAGLRIEAWWIAERGDLFQISGAPWVGVLNAGETVRATIEFRSEGRAEVIGGELRVRSLGPSGSGGSRLVSVPLEAEVAAPPPQATAMTLILSWGTDATDVDIHLVRPGGRPFSGSDDDCFYANSTPDWGRFGDPIDDPFLDRDDTDGFGPEVINLSEASPGEYEVWVHYFASNGQGPSDASVEVYLSGQVAGTYPRSQLFCNQLWRVGIIRWDGTGGFFEPGGPILTIDRGNCI